MASNKDFSQLPKQSPRGKNGGATDGAPSFHALDLLGGAATALKDRARTRDAADGERSMAKTVAAFNAVFGTDLSEEQGWQFMVILKMVRGSQGEAIADDYTDEAGYAALAGEAAGKERGA